MIQNPAKHQEDKRLIEDYLPIVAISAEASREKSVRKGHISTLHLWWARRPLVACRAAVYGALVPASRFVPENGPDNKKQSLGRANAAKFITDLCKYPGDTHTIQEAQRHILIAHAERLTRELQASKSPSPQPSPSRGEGEAKGGARSEGEGVPAWVKEFKFKGDKIAVEDITAGRAPRPRVLDMFAGGGAIPLEALRLGCEAYALDLNPVAHIIQLCTLVYPQKYGKPDPAARGMTGPKNEKGETTWGGLAEEVRYWGNWVLKKVKTEIGDLYPLIPDPEFRGKEQGGTGGTGFGSTGFGSTGFQPVQKDLFITRRNLPHWQIGGSTYFVTFRTKGLELSSAARKLVLDACLHFDGQRYVLWSAVVMPDHVHLLFQPREMVAQASVAQASSLCMHSQDGCATKWWSLSSILHSIKSYTANRINEMIGCTGTVWQEESFDRIVRDEGEFLEKWNYIRDNPVKKQLAESPEKWVGFYECTGKMPVPPDETQPGFLMPVAYLWTRTVKCKNPACGATVPLVKQTWLCKKDGRYVAMKMVAPKGKKEVRFKIVEVRTEKELGFDPSAFSKAGNAACPFCGTVADSDHVKAEGCVERMGQKLMAVVCTRPGTKGKVYLAADEIPNASPDEADIHRRIEKLCHKTDLTLPNERIEVNPRSMDTHRFGLTTWASLYSRRQQLTLLHFASALRILSGYKLHYPSSASADRLLAICTHIAAYHDRAADHWSTLCTWNPVGEKLQHTFARQSLPMVWDFVEANPWGGSVGDWAAIVENAENGIRAGITFGGQPAHVARGSAMELPFDDSVFDAIITDPPYYDNVSYSNLSDFFYVWLKRSIGLLYPEHFAGEATPKGKEAIAAFYRHGGDKDKSRRAYEEMMAKAFREAHRRARRDAA